jgi:hypothetical protein
MGHPVFDFFLCSVVFFNLVVVVAETDYKAEHGTDRSLQWVNISNTVLIIFYTVELSFRGVVYGRHLLRDRTNWLDMGIIGFDLFMIPISAVFGDIFSVSFLRVFRLVRLGRSWRIMKVSPELAILLKGLVSTAKSIFVGTLLLLVMLTVSSIVAVEFIHPVNLEVHRLTAKYDGCDRCIRAFATVWDANLTFFQQLIAGDSWGAVTIPVIEQNPTTAIFFITVHVSIAIGVMNLLLAVIVDRANAARAEDKKALLREEQREKQVLGKHLMNVCGALDTDGSKTLSLQELQEGWNENDDFQTTMQAMDIGEEDIAAVFNILDSDQSGTVQYEEFVEQLWKMKSTDQQTMLIFIKYYVCDIRNKQCSVMKALEQQLLNDFGAIREMLNRVLSDEQKELAELAQIESDVTMTEQLVATGKPMPMTQPIATAMPQAKAPAQAPAKQIIQEAPPQAIANIRSVNDDTQELMSMRSANEETSTLVKQCLAQLQQLTQVLQAGYAPQIADRPRTGIERLWAPASCLEVSRAPPPPQSLLVVPRQVTTSAVAR